MSRQTYITPLTHHTALWFKGVIGCKIHFSKLFEHKCVGSVFTHPSYNDKNPPSVFFLIPNIKAFFSNQAVLRFLSE